MKRSKSYASEDSDDHEEGGRTMFQRIFMGASGDSSAGSYDDSVGSGTLGTDSASEYTGGDQTDDGSEGPEEKSDRGLQKFDRELRAKHRAACKNMTVRFTTGQHVSGIASSMIVSKSFNDVFYFFVSSP